MTSWGVLEEIRRVVDANARADMRTAIEWLRLSRVDHSEPGYTATAPLLIVMAQGGKRILLGDQVHEYRAGQFLVVTTELPVTGHFIASPSAPALAMSIELRPSVIAPLLLRLPDRWSRAVEPAIATGAAAPELLDAVARLLRLLDRPFDAPVLAPLIEQEILWHLLTGPHGGMIRQVGLAGSALSQVSRAIQWIRDNYAEPVRIEELARLASMSPSAFHRHFRAVTAMSPLQFRKRIRLQEARSLLVARAGDVAGVAHLVGYDSTSQFTREYRGLFGAPPAQDAARLRG